MTNISISGISKSFGRTKVLDEISLEVKDGEFFFILGPSGCGKTTLLRILAGLEQPDKGNISFGDVEVTNLPPQKRNVGLVFQNYALWPHMTVEENIRFGLTMHGLSKAVQDERIAEVLALIQMESLRDRSPGDLSGGQQQRVALARALALKPQLLLLDEPLSNLDARLREGIRDEIRHLHSTLGITMIFVTHDREEVLAAGERACIMRNGRIEQTATPGELYRAPLNRFIAEFLGEANLFAGVLKKMNSAWVVDCPDTGEILIGNLRSGEEGLPYTVLIRPEVLRLDSTRGFEGKVTQNTFFGAFTKTKVLLRQGKEVLILRQGNTDQVTVGETVRVHIDPGSCVLLPADRDRK